MRALTSYSMCAMSSSISDCLSVSWKASPLGPRARGLVLAAEGEGVTWYVEGRPLDPDPVSGRAIWKPAAAGFYRLEVVDARGRKAKARVRIKGG